MEAALRAKLLATAALTSIVAQRIDWGLRSQGTILPGIALHKVSGLPFMNLAGPSGWARDLVQLDVWGRTFKASEDLADIIAGKPGVPGLLAGFRDTVGGVRLRTFINGRRNDADSSDAAGPVFRSSVDLTVFHSA